MKLDTKQNKIHWLLIAAISLLTCIVVLNLIMNQLMILNIIPDDWYCFHDYLHRTGSLKVVAYLVAVGLALSITFLQKRFKLVTPKSIPLIMFWILLSTSVDALGHMFGWIAHNAPFTIIWYDNLAHIVGGVVYANVSWIIWKNVFLKKKIIIPDWVTLVLASLTMIAIGMLYGIYEYYSDMFRHTYMVGGVKDAITDYVYDVVGASISGILLAIHYSWGRFANFAKKSPFKYLTSIKY